MRRLLAMLIGGSRAHGARIRQGILAARSAELDMIRAELPDVPEREEWVRAYADIQKGTMAWAHQDLGLAIADLFDPPKGDNPK